MLPYNVENDIMPIICKARGGLLEVHNGAAAAAAEPLRAAAALPASALTTAAAASVSSLASGDGQFGSATPMPSAWAFPGSSVTRWPLE
jgi:hypothetical protein